MGKTDLNEHLDQETDRFTKGRPEYGILALIESSRLQSAATFRIIDGERSFDFASFLMHVGMMASVLQDQGFKTGDKVLLASRNSYEFFLLLSAVSWLGGTTAIADYELSANTIHDLQRQSGAKIIFTDRPLTGLSTTLLPQISDLESHCERQAPCKGFDAGPDQVSLILFTSGTSSGMPRGIMVSNRNISFTARAIQERLQYRPDDRVGLFLSAAFDVGLYQFFLSLISGATLIICNREDAGPLLLKHLKQQRVTVLPAVPSLLEILSRFVRHRKTVLHLRMVTTTGEAFHKKSQESLLESLPQLDIFLMYGLTECKRVSILDARERATRYESVGIPLKGVSAFVEDATGKLLSKGEGELVIEGPNVCLGYLDNDEEAKGTFRTVSIEGHDRKLLYTGDIFRIDDAGYLYFIGRRKTFLKHREFRISPLEIESVVNSLPNVRRSIALTHDGRLVVLVEAAGAVEPETIHETVRRLLPPYKRPTDILLQASIPLTANGKIDRIKVQSTVDDVMLRTAQRIL